MKKNDLLNVSKISGIMFEYNTKDLRLLLRVFMEEPDDPKSKYMVKLSGYIGNSHNCHTIAEFGDYDTYSNALSAGVKLVEDNFNLVEVE